MSNTQHNDGGPAFPQDLQGRRGDDPSLQGMTLRDWFAGQALPKVIQWWLTDLETGRLDKSVDFMGASDKDCIAAEAYAMADAMLKAREVKP